ncbi:hypothetical protein COV17_00720 [Candidatus Woesearchaeota archaeon CG10_big_fil_rev_8_21_14_0_10_36_11]|nr:MAG: hypothetical protein COV17_00720 [Candidatus Woesearchaeota archaeon CG10_big_fil_rev_8_21_14_0_10_36_11]
MADQDKILQFLRVTGPTLPSKVAKNIGTEILIASAHLSDLTSQRKVRISHLKVGGSPLYYLPGQEEQLYPFAAGNMNAKDAAVLDMLKERKVLREHDIDLLAKVALRSLKDFAVPLQVTVRDTKELFWKWNFCSDDETNNLIRKILGVREPQPIEDQASAPVLSQDIVKSDNPVSHEELSHEKHVREDSVEHVKSEIKDETKENAIHLPDQKRDTLTTSSEHVHLKESFSKGEFQRESKKDEEQKTLEPEKSKKPLFKKIKDKIIRQKQVKVKDEFLPQIESFFTNFKICVEQQETVRKNAEINFLIKVPTAVGEMMYFCKAKSKNKADEKDLSTAYMEAQMKKLPLLFLYTKEINKKAEEMMDSGAFENAIMKKID